MEPVQQTKAEPQGSLNGFWVLIMIGLAFGSGFMADRSIAFMPNGLMTVAHVWLIGLVISLALLIAAFSVSGMLISIRRSIR